MNIDKPPRTLKLADLMCGHPADSYSLLPKGHFEPEKHPSAPAIQLCQLRCGCWIVEDGNSRIGLLLRENSEATLADIPRELLSVYTRGEWDEEIQEWWNPEPKSFGQVLATKRTKRGRKPRGKKNDILYGIIEREAHDRYVVGVMNGPDKKPHFLTATSPSIARKKLTTRLQAVFKNKNLTIEINGIDSLEPHRCPGNENVR